ncbi:hypothetical protein [Fructobacillus evanidus]|uniref:Contains 6-pyruvoyl-tetrahydropterin synthase (PTPS)-related domain (PTPS) n=2 Tax=Fructobacillus evanidus TaxID=3064281 RepID=A0ABM9N2S4_9LACO|nr:Predicted membrane glycosyltransferase TK1552 [Fructobacillus sp. LMG 32999]CAK1254550.1 Predicted membrane glycosyltransferase TK1552 [Fructobacillus sp. LMG 32999]CAK1254692.1 Predicted membrane glycosyltransferase TK1552 [Fructobacillus sp. LMG 32999]CAK1254852.1 Predicted membrane glycosyltransferase TK1552 [Fructobacillus sp. LMG 32999]CAK1255194.1 Predicted membrane glycosyltransferase TK1552 [Fructobacillus sp. LMG 32999]
MHFFNKALSPKTLQKIYQEVTPFLIMFILVVLFLNTILFNPIKFPLDSYYHFSRIHNLSGNFLQFLYPQNFLSLGQIGVASNVFYPSLGLQLIVNFFPFIHNSLLLYKIVLLMINFLLAAIFYSILHFKLRAQPTIAAILSLLWSGSVFSLFNIAEATAAIGIPLIVYGLFNHNEKNSYKCIAIGLSISWSSHILLSTIISLFVFVYLLICFFTNKTSKKFVFLSSFKAIFFTFLLTLGTLLPLIYISTTNKIKMPNMGYYQFQTWYITVQSFFTETKLIVTVLVLLFIIATIILIRDIFLGQILSLILAIFGTSAVTWEPFLKHTSLISIQIPYRLFYYFLIICLGFTIVVFATFRKSSTNSFKKILATFTFLAMTVISMTLQKDNYADIDIPGNFVVATPGKIHHHYMTGQDGYGLDSLGAFDRASVHSSDIWYLMNYSDYVPQQALANQNSSFMLSDTKGKHFIKHQLKTNTGQYIDTHSFKASYNQLSFVSTKDIDSNTIYLPVLGYQHTNISVFINHTKVSSSIEDGQIAVHQRINSGDQIMIKQYMPIWEILPFIVVLATLVFLFLLR